MTVPSWINSAMGFFASWGIALWRSLLESSPFLLLGFFFAGLLHVIVPGRLVLWALGRRGFWGAVRGALVGAPLPLCSCGVIPTAIALRRQGASASACAAFTISTPETSADAIAITAAMLPAAFLPIRPLASLILAVGVGTVVGFLTRSVREDLNLSLRGFARTDRAEGGGGTDEICRVCGLLDSREEHRHGLFHKLRAVFGYALGTFFEDIAMWLAIGLVAASLFEVLLPVGGIQGTWLGAHKQAQILGAILVGIPIYSCATATTPLVAVLLAKGIDPGAALALLLAGPATNIGNVLVLRREFGTRATAGYFGTLFFLCWVLGSACSFAWTWIAKFPTLTGVWREGASGGVLGGGAFEAVELASAVVLLALFARWLAKQLTRSRELHAHGHECEGHEH